MDTVCAEWVEVKMEMKMRKSIWNENEHEHEQAAFIESVKGNGTNEKKSKGFHLFFVGKFS